MKTLNDILDHAAETSGVGIATERSFISYADLRRRVLSLAAALEERGIKPGDRVAIVHRNDPVFIEAYFALARLGAVAVPINYMIHHPEELAYMLNDCGAAGVFTQKEFLKGLRDAVKIAPHAGRLWISDAGPSDGDGAEEPYSKLLEASPRETAHEVQEADVAAILYTSGTTGKPKGVMLTHKNLATNSEAGIECLRVNARDVFLCLLPMFHTYAWTANVLIPLRLGAKLVIAPSITPPKSWLRLMARHKVTLFSAVPQIHSLLAKSAKGVKGLVLKYWYFRKVRMAVSGAAPLNPAATEAFKNAFGLRILEGYGLTETSPVISINPPENPKLGSVGRPIGGAEVKIVDQDERALPLRQEGEICVKGDCVMKGYYHLPDQTRSALTRDGYFKTGDIGLLDEDGYLFIRDRKKDMIIIKGLKVFPAQIEASLAENPDILESAVVGIPDERGDEMIKAFVVLKPGSKEDKASLMKYCREKIDAYKRPRDVEIMDSLPKNSLQKILKRDLRALEIKKRAVHAAA